MIYTLGVDPGQRGGYALVTEEGSLIKFGVLDTTSQGFRSILLECLEIADNQLEAILERPFLAQSGNHTMYINYGRLLANLELKNIKYTEIRSQQWLKFHNLKKSKKNKKPSTLYIPRVFPEFIFKGTKRSKNIHDGITDACCIALFNIKKIIN